MNQSRYYFSLFALWSALFLIWHSPVEAAYPERTVRIVVSTGPGGGADLLARVVASKLQEIWSQPVVIDNRPGGNGTIGLATVVHAKPDGYTLALYSSLQADAPLLNKLDFDAINGIEPISVVAIQPDILVVNSSLPARSMKELIALAKASPGKLKYGTAGVAVQSTFALELLKKEAGVDILQVSYKQGWVEALLRGDEIQMFYMGIASSLEQIKAGNFRALAVSGNSRAALLPDVPTMTEATGLSGFENTGNFYGIAAPKGTPDEIINKVNEGLVAAVNDPAVKATLLKMGFQAGANKPKEFDKMIREENAKWAPIVKSLGLEPQ